jgi:hypothetical protein
LSRPTEAFRELRARLQYALPIAREPEAGRRLFFRVEALIRNTQSGKKRAPAEIITAEQKWQRQPVTEDSQPTRRNPRVDRDGGRRDHKNTRHLEREMPYAWVKRCEQLFKELPEGQLSSVASQS